jgi:hypothetical protein
LYNSSWMRGSPSTEPFIKSASENIWLLCWLKIMKLCQSKGALPHLVHHLLV